MLKDIRKGVLLRIMEKVQYQYKIIKQLEKEIGVKLRMFQNKEKFFETSSCLIDGSKNIIGLNLSGNLLGELPDTIGNLEYLSVLYLSDNQLMSIPDSIGNLRRLREFYLERNNLTTLPESITELKNLDVINLSGNPLYDPPLDVVDMGIETICEYFMNKGVAEPA